MIILHSNILDTAYAWLGEPRRLILCTFLYIKTGNTALPVLLIYYSVSLKNC